MKSVTFNRLAERELAKAIRYYEREVPGLGYRFLDEVQRALALVADHPEIARKIRGNTRRLVLPKFPYYLLYRPRPAGGVHVLAVSHQKRHPEHWIGRR